MLPAPLAPAVPAALVIVLVLGLKTHSLPPNSLDIGCELCPYFVLLFPNSRSLASSVSNSLFPPASLQCHSLLSLSCVFLRLLCPCCFSFCLSPLFSPLHSLHWRNVAACSAPISCRAGHCWPTPVQGHSLENCGQ